MRALTVWAMAAPEPPHGATLGGTLEVVALGAIILALVGLVLVEFVLKSRMARSTYRWTLLLGASSSCRAWRCWAPRGICSSP